MNFNKLVILVCGLAYAVLAHADYQLDVTSSSLHFISIKKDKIAETHTFKKITGGISANGSANIAIDLNSVETHIDIRNERMKTMLFETAMFPTAVVSTSVDAVQLEGLQVGEMIGVPVELSIDLHGKIKKTAATLSVVKLTSGNILVTTTKPILLNAFDFGLVSGIQALMEVAKLPSIATAVPVSFSLVFKSE